DEAHQHRADVWLRGTLRVFLVRRVRVRPVAHAARRPGPLLPCDLLLVSRARGPGSLAGSRLASTTLPSEESGAVLRRAGRHARHLAAPCRFRLGAAAPAAHDGPAFGCPNSRRWLRIGTAVEALAAGGVHQARGLRSVSIRAHRTTARIDDPRVLNRGARASGGRPFRPRHVPPFARAHARAARAFTRGRGPAHAERSVSGRHTGRLVRGLARVRDRLGRTRSPPPFFPAYP